MSIYKKPNLSITTFIKYEYDSNGDWGQYCDIENQVIFINNNFIIKTTPIKPLPTILEEEIVVAEEKPRPIPNQAKKAEESSPSPRLSQTKKAAEESSPIDKRFHVAGIFCIATLLFS